MHVRPPRVVLTCGLAFALLSSCGDAAGGGDTSTGATTGSLDGGASSHDPHGSSASAGTTADSGGSGGGSDAAGSGGNGSDGGQPVGPGGCAGEGEPLTELEQAIADLPADTWWTAPDTKMRAVCPADLDASACTNVIAAWSGGAWDPVHRQLLVFGGGHGDSSDNTLYAFELGTLRWSALTEHSPAEYRDGDPLPDAQPVSRHSYDGLQYLVGAQRLFAWGGSQWQNGGITNLTWLYDHASGWHDTGVQPPMSYTYGHATAYDPTTDRVYLHSDYGLRAYDPADNTWTTLTDYGAPPYWPRYSISGDFRGVVDTSRSLLWYMGADLYLVYDLVSGDHVTDAWITEGGGEFTNADYVDGDPEQVITTGGAAILAADGPGVDYDPRADAMVGWTGGGPWVLDLPSKTWTQRSAVGAPSEPGTSGGTFGRWRYVPRVNAFVLVTGVDADVVFYKHTPGCGP